MERQKLGDALVQKGKYPEALTEYLWCFDHGRDSVGYYGVRLSFLLADIVRLGQKYPSAIKALEDRRDTAEATIVSGKGAFNEVQDFASLNQYLKVPERTLALYDRLHAEGKLTKDTKLALGDELLDPLIAARRYADVIECVGDVEATVRQSIELSKMAAKLQKGRDHGSENGNESVLDALKQSRVDEMGKYYEALLGAGQPKTADSVAERIIKFDPTGATFSSLIEHAVRAGADDAARALVDRATKALSEKEFERVKLAASKIPAKK
jgi:hypothetical protein